MAADRTQAIGQIGRRTAGVGDGIQEFREEGVVIMLVQIRLLKLSDFFFQYQFDIQLSKSYLGKFINF